MKRFLKPAIIYGVLFSVVGIIGAKQNQFDIRLTVHKFENGFVTFILENHGPDIYYESNSGHLGEIEIFYKKENIFLGSFIHCCQPPEKKTLKRGKGIKFKVFPYKKVDLWRYSLDVSYESRKPEWMRKAYELVNKKRLPDTFIKTIKSPLILNGAIQE